MESEVKSLDDDFEQAVETVEFSINIVVAICVSFPENSASFKLSSTMTEVSEERAVRNDSLKLSRVMELRFRISPADEERQSKKSSLL